MSVRSSTGHPRRGGLARAATAIVLATGEAVVLLLTGATFLAASSGYDIPITTVAAALATLSFVTVGGFLVAKAGGNVVGWLLWTSGLLLAISLGAGYVANEGLNVSPGSISGALWFAWLSNWMGAPGLLLAAGILPLYFPTGRTLSIRWQAVAVVGLAAIGVGVLAAMFGPFQAGTYPAGVDNPLVVGGITGDLLAAVGGIGYAVFGLVVFPVSVASLVVRHRRSTEIERRQLVPFAILAGLIVAALVLAQVAGGEFFWLVAVGGLALLPLAIGIAVLRYRLYEIDRLVSRTLAYGLVTVVLVAVFSGAILLLQALLSPLTGGNALAVAGSTLLVAALFQPLRRRVQGLVDRRFNRRRYDAQVAVDAFSARLRDEVDLEILQGSLLTLVEATLEPSTVSIWLRD